MGRSCARPACSGSATATLSYDYADATVWIESLHPEADPMRHDLCERHGTRVSVPRGWTLVDERARQVATRSVGGSGLPLASAAPVTDAWDPSGTVPAEARPSAGTEGHPNADDGAVVLEPTLFGDWSAENDRHSLAS